MAVFVVLWAFRKIASLIKRVQPVTELHLFTQIWAEKYNEIALTRKNYY